jgi:hypothetical protein
VKQTAGISMLLATVAAILMATAPLVLEKVSAEAARYFDELRKDFDTSQTLSWNFIVSRVAESDVEKVLEELKAMGFSLVEIPEGAEEAGTFSIWCSEARKHSRDSFVTRVVEMQRLSAKYGAMLDDWSAGRQP